MPRPAPVTMATLPEKRDALIYYPSPVVGPKLNLGGQAIFGHYSAQVLVLNYTGDNNSLDYFQLPAHLLKGSQAIVQVFLAVGCGVHDADASQPFRHSGKAQRHGKDTFLE